MLLYLVHLHWVGVGLVLDVHRDAVGHSKARDCRRHEHLPLRLRHRRKKLLDPADEYRRVLLRERALVPALEVDDERSLVLAAPADHAPAGDGNDARDLRKLAQELHRPQRRVAAAVAGGALRHLHRGEDDALVLVGEEGRLRLHEERDRKQYRQQQQHSREEYAACEPLGGYDEEPLDAVHEPVEPRKRAMLERARLAQQERAQRGRKRKRAQGGEADRRGKRDGELLVDAPCDSTHEADRHEDSEEDERRRYDRARDVAHRLDRGLLRVEPPRLDEELHALHDDDAVVDYDAYREDEPEQGQDVDGVAEEGHEDERRAKRDGNRQDRYERRTPVLQEEVADKHDEAEGYEEREDNLLHAHAHVVGGVVWGHPLEVVGEGLCEVLHLLVDLVHRRDCVRAGLLLQGDGDCVPRVELAREHVVFLADFRAGDVLEPHKAAILVAADDDLVELLRRHKPPLRGQRIDVRAVLRDGRGADRADRRLDVLLRDRRDDFLGVEALRGHAVRVEPDAHRDPRAIDRRLADAGDSQKDGLDVAVDVVRYLQARHRTLRRPQADYAEHVLGLRAYAPAELLHLGRQLRLGLRDAVLDLYHVHVAVGLDLERQRELVGARVGAGAYHVEHVVYAVHLVLDGHRDGVQNLLRVRARVVVHDAYRRRRETRILRDREPRYRHHARHRKHDRYDHRKARALHEYTRKRLYLVY